MENAKAIWEELGLPKLKPKAPWFGYSLGDWSERNEQMAKRAVLGDYFVTGEEIAKQRRSDVAMNTEIKGRLEEQAARAIAGGVKKKGPSNPFRKVNESKLKPRRCGSARGWLR